jgi:plastocyanin
LACAIALTSHWSKLTICGPIQRDPAINVSSKNCLCVSLLLEMPLFDAFGRKSGMFVIAPSFPVRDYGVVSLADPFCDLVPIPLSRFGPSRLKGSHLSRRLQDDRCARCFANKGEGNVKHSIVPLKGIGSGTADNRHSSRFRAFGASIAAAQPPDLTPSGGAESTPQESPASLPTNEMRPIEVKIISTEFKFMPAKIRIAAGRAVALVLDNSGGETEHEVSFPAFGFRLQAKAGEITRRTTVFNEPGEYDFACNLPGHREAGMGGTLVVTDSLGER